MSWPTWWRVAGLSFILSPNEEQLVKKANLSLATSQYSLHLNLVHLKLVWNWKFSAILPLYPFQFLLTRSRLSLWVRRRVRPPTVRYLPSLVRSTCVLEDDVIWLSSEHWQQLSSALRSRRELPLANIGGFQQSPNKNMNKPWVTHLISQSHIIQVTTLLSQRDNDQT